MKLGVLLAACVISTASTAQAGNLRTGIDTLNCGSSRAVVQSTCTNSGHLSCTRQTMVVRAADRPGKTHKVSLHPDTDQPVPTTLISWACITSTSGTHYFVLDYACVVGAPACTDELQQLEFTQIVDANGRSLASGDEGTMVARLGLKHMDENGLKMTGLTFGQTKLQGPRKAPAR